MKENTKFHVGDKVFAKVEGFPARPAIVINKKKAKYYVRFYDTGKTESVKAKYLFYYLKFKETFVKNLKRKDYKEAIEEIEKAIKESGTDGNDDNEASGKSAIPELNESLVDSTKSTKRKRISTSDIRNLAKRKTITSNVSAGGNSGDDNSQSTEPHSLPGDTLNEDTEDIKVKKNKTKKKQKNETTNKTKQSTSTAYVKSNKKFKEKKKINGTESEIADNDMTTLEELKIITIPHMLALSSYVEHVINNEEVYIKMPAVNRQNLFNEVVLAKLENDRFVCLKYNRAYPTNFENEYQQVVHDKIEALRVLRKKNSLENGILKVEDVTDDLEPGVILNDEQLEHMLELDLTNRKKAKLKFLAKEARLINLDAIIKASLELDKADPKNALVHLSIMAEMNIEPLMLKKHPHIVETVKRLRTYVGNVEEWGMNEEQQEQFKTEAKKICEKTQEVYVNFAKLFGITDTSEFWDIFNTKVAIFKGQVIGLKSKIIILTAEPSSRRAFIEEIDDEHYTHLL